MALWKAIAAEDSDSLCTHSSGHVCAHDSGRKHMRSACVPIRMKEDSELLSLLWRSLPSLHSAATVTLWP